MKFFFVLFRPFWTAAWWVRATTQTAREEYQSAVSYLDRIADLRPLRFRENVLRAYVQLSLGNDVAALECLDKASGQIDNSKGLSYDERQHILKFMHAIVKRCNTSKLRRRISLPQQQSYDVNNVRGFIFRTFSTIGQYR